MPKRVHGGASWEEEVEDFSSNLNPLGVPQGIREKIDKCISKEVYRYYPDPSYKKLVETLASFYRLRNELVIPTSGASEAIFLVIKCAALKGFRRVMTISPTFGEDEIVDLSRELGLKVDHVGLVEINDRFLIDFDAVLSRLKSSEKSVVIMSNPNNPTGLYVDIRVIEELLDQVKERGVVVVDEAYIELSGRSSSVELLDNKDLVVIRSLTKLFATPGLRVGSLMTRRRELASCVDVLRPTWSIDSLSSCVFSGEPLLSEEWVTKFVEESVNVIRRWRNELEEEARRLGLRVYRSETNFVLLKNEVVEPQVLYRRLESRRVKVRNCSSFRGLSERYFRVAVKDPSKTSILLSALREALGLEVP